MDIHLPGFSERRETTPSRAVSSLIGAILLSATLCALLPWVVHAQAPCGETVIVTPGDTLRGIAQRCGVAFDDLAAVNPQIENFSLIYAGQVIRIPQSGVVRSEAILTISPISGPPGTDVSIAATGFPTNGEIVFTLGLGEEIFEINRLVTGPGGMSETGMTVPNDAPAGEDVQIVAYVVDSAAAAGQDNVIEAAATFAVTEAQAAPEPRVSVLISPTFGAPGTAVTLRAGGLAANAPVEIGAGETASEYDIIAQGQADAQGEISRTVRIPELADAGETWVIAVTPVGSPADYVSNPFAVTENDGSQNLVTSTNIYLVALEDSGRNGMQIGCGDSVVPVEIQIEPTLAVLTTSLTRLVNLDQRFYGQSGLYNALANSDLSVGDIDLVDGRATINLTGDLAVGGVCDIPRVTAQLRQTALQYFTVNAVDFTVNGEPLGQVVQQ